MKKRLKSFTIAAFAAAYLGCAGSGVGGSRARSRQDRA